VRNWRNMDEIQDDLGRSPEQFPHALNVRDDSVAFVRLAKADYETASFLDARILTGGRESRSVSWPQVAATIDALRLTERCDYIFHIGHVGSTLLSRLVGAHRGAFALREPAVLRTFAQLRDEPDAKARAWHDAAFEERLSGCLKLLSRTFGAQQIAVIKATSFVSEIAAALLSRPSRPKALMMFVSPESYIATILGGPNSRQEARVLAPSRLGRLHRRLRSEQWQLEQLGEGEILALAWACEVTALAQAANAAVARALRLDFDRFLADPLLLLAVLRHFGIDASLSEAHAILRGPHLRRYSKAPEYAYDAALRRDVLNEARAVHGEEIRRGLAWLDRAAAQFAAVREAMLFAA
jgi:hypothetical protein